MHVIDARNVNDAYRKGLRLMHQLGQERPSRNGGVLRITEPVSTVYHQPVERVLFDLKRDANPFFHLFEALWMLHGGNDVQTLDHILKSFAQFSDDGRTYHGAYGHRWRHWPIHSPTYTTELDQIAKAIEMLEADPTNRRVVIGMWDPARDLGTNSKDIPCNDIIFLEIDDNHLNMAIGNRSNDIIWGCYGANAVHMSMLFEYLCAQLGCLFGTMTQISFNFHAYLATPYRWEDFYPPTMHEEIDWTDEDLDWVNNYETVDDGERNMGVHPLVTARDSFDDELHAFISAIKNDRSVSSLNREGWDNAFFARVAIPMHLAMEYCKTKEYDRALEIVTVANEMGEEDIDWLTSAHQWISRRRDAKVSASYRIPESTHGREESRR